MPANYSIRLSFFFLFLFSVPLFAQDNGNYDRIDILLARGEYDQAVTILNESIKKDSLNAGLYYRLGLAYQGAYRSEKAADAFSSAIRLDSSKAVYYSEMGRTLESLGMYKKAVDHYMTAYSRDSSNKSIAFSLAGVFMSEEAYDQAAEVYNKILQRDTMNSFIYAQLGYCALKSDSVRLSASYYEKAHALNPSNITSAQQLAINYIKLDSTRLANALIDESLQLYPDNSLLHKLKADIYFRKKNYLNAAVYYKNAINTGDLTSSVFQKLGYCYFYYAGLNDSLNANQKLVYFEEAKAALEYSYLIEPGNPRTCFYLGALNSELGKFDTSIVYFEKAAKSGTLEFMPELYSRLGASYLVLKKYDDAAAAYKKSLIMKFNIDMAFNNLVYIYTTQGKQERVTSLYNEFIEDDMTIPEIRKSSLKLRVTNSGRIINKNKASDKGAKP